MNDEIHPILPMARQQSEAKRDGHLWRSCCVEMDSRALLFFSQLLISLIVLLFCISRIALTLGGDDCYLYYRGLAPLACGASVHTHVDFVNVTLTQTTQNPQWGVSLR